MRNVLVACLILVPSLGVSALGAQVAPGFRYFVPSSPNLQYANVDERGMRFVSGDQLQSMPDTEFETICARVEAMAEAPNASEANVRALISQTAADVERTARFLDSRAAAPDPDLGVSARLATVLANAKSSSRATRLRRADRVLASSLQPQRTARVVRTFKKGSSTCVTTSIDGYHEETHCSQGDSSQCVEYSPDGWHKETRCPWDDAPRSDPREYPGR